MGAIAAQAGEFPHVSRRMILLPNNQQWVRSAVVLCEPDEQFCEDLSFQLDELGAKQIVLAAPNTVGKVAIAEYPQVFLVPISGSANRLCWLRELRARDSEIGVVLVSRDIGASFTSHCFALGANAVLSRSSSCEEIARMTLAIATSE